MLATSGLWVQSGEVSATTVMEDSCDDNQELEEHNLSTQAFDDDILGQIFRYLGKSLVTVLVFPCSRLFVSTSCLQEETEHVAADEDLDKPGAADERELLAFCESNDTSEDHVGGCNEKRGR